jgi:hypothetical protein
MLDFHAHTCPFQNYCAIKALYGNNGPPFARPKISKKLEKTRILSFFLGYGLAVKNQIKYRYPLKRGKPPFQWIVTFCCVFPQNLVSTETRPKVAWALWFQGCLKEALG